MFTVLSESVFPDTMTVLIQILKQALHMAIANTDNIKKCVHQSEFLTVQNQQKLTGDDCNIGPVVTMSIKRLRN